MFSYTASLGPPLIEYLILFRLNIFRLLSAPLFFGGGWGGVGREF